MINTGLDKKYEAKEQQNVDFSPIPDGEYTLRVTEISPWKPQTKTIKVIQRDNDGKAIKNEKNENVTETVPNCTFYNCNVQLKVVGGSYDGRIVFHNLSTHPNMPFAIPAFLYGLGMKELAASEIQEKTKGLTCLGEVFTDSYDKTVQNKDTGLEETKKNYINRIKNFKQLPATNPNTTNEEDFGI